MLEDTMVKPEVEVVPMDKLKVPKIVWSGEERYLWWFYKNDYAKHVPTCAEYGIDLEVTGFQLDVQDWLCMREALWAQREGLLNGRPSVGKHE